MTAPDPIREALEAAADSLRRPWPTFSTRGMSAEQQRQRAHETAAARVIAAFHRRLAETSPCEIDAEISSELADAVEAAAREADHA